MTEFPPNGYGVYNMIGNVWEWTADWFSARHTADDRVSANHWEFVRTDEGWKIMHRTLRPLDGASSRELGRRADCST